MSKFAESNRSDEFFKEMKTCTRCDLHKGRTQVVVGDYADTKEFRKEKENHFAYYPDNHNVIIFIF